MTGEARVQRPQADEIDVDPVTGKKEERPRERKRPTFTGSLPPPETRSGVAESWSPATSTGLTSAPPRASGAPTWPGPPGPPSSPGMLGPPSSAGTAGPWSSAGTAPWTSAPPPPAQPPSAPAPPPSAQEAQLIQELTQRVRAMIQLQQQSALELQAVFESCVARGLVERTQYLDRMAQLDPAHAQPNGQGSAPASAPAGPRPVLPPMPPPGPWR